MIKDLKVGDNGECFSVSKGMNESIGNSKFNGFDISRLQCFSFYIFDYFKRDCLERGGAMKILFRL